MSIVRAIKRLTGTFTKAEKFETTLGNSMTPSQKKKKHERMTTGGGLEEGNPKASKNLMINIAMLE